MPEPGWYLPYMTSGERVLWQTEPEKRRLSFRLIALFSAVLLAALCIPLGMLLYHALIRSSSPHLPSLVVSIAGALWAGLALCQTLIPWLLRQTGRRHPEYVLTDRRILRIRGNLVDSAMLHQLPEPHITPEKDGTTTLHFWPVAAKNPERDSLRSNLGSLMGLSIRHVQHGPQLLAALKEVRVKHERPRPIGEEPLIPLEKGESLLWQGAPAGRRPLDSLLTGRYITGISDGWFAWSWGLVISVGFGAMVLLEVGWLWDMWPMYALLLIVALTCALMLLGAFRGHTRRPRNVAYVLTDRRLIRRIDGQMSEIRLEREAGTPVYLAQGRSGTATLMLCSLPLSHGGTRVVLPDSSAVMEGFLLRSIPDAARVADLIAAVQAQFK